MPSSTGAISSFSRSSAWIALIAAAAAGGILVALLAIRSDVDPGRQMISEYALGPHGSVMTLCFVAFAVASAALLLALVGQVDGPTARIGLLFLLAAALGPALASYFPTDPITPSAGPMTFSGKMHGVSFLIGVPGEILATLLLSLFLRKRDLWARVPLMSLTALIWLSLIAMIVGMVLGAKGGGSGWIGWPNRSFMLAYATWVIAVAYPLASLSREPLSAAATRP